MQRSRPTWRPPATRARHDLPGQRRTSSRSLHLRKPCLQLLAGEPAGSLGGGHAWCAPCTAANCGNAQVRRAPPSNRTESAMNLIHAIRRPAGILLWLASVVLASLTAATPAALAALRPPPPGRN